ncbi:MULTISPECIES: TonB-dependent receptor [unclassified Vibrio]|uniref:TonB-dependent receptor n=1 Tax=unclassified Vibrio TaxID=2614977 RepID=UPI0035538730
MTALRPATVNELGNSRFKLRTLSAIIMGLSVSGQAFAATNNNNETTTNEDKTTFEVTVYGEKIERSIYDTGSSVHVYDEDRIASTPGASEVDDLLQLTPNIVDSGQGNNLPSIRGVDGSGPSIGGLAAFGGSVPRLNLSIDGRSLSYSEVAFGPRSLWDMQQAEIYLGPQSYVQGRNASAGAIVLKSNDPTYDFESKVKAAIGQQDYSQTAAVISAPILEDQLAFRLSVDQQKRSSYADLTAYEPVGDPNRIEMTTARGKFLLEPAGLPGFKTTLTIAHMDTVGPQSESQQTKINRAVYETQSTSGIWDVSYDISDTLVFENNLIYTERTYDRITDPAGRKQDFKSKGNEFQIEPLVRFDSLSEDLSGLFGLRYFKSEDDDVFEQTGSSIPMEGKNRAMSAFAEVTYLVMPSIEVVAAGRFERESKKRYVAPGRFGLDYDETSNVFLPKLEVAYKPESDQTVGIRAAKGFNSGGGGVGFNNKTWAFSSYTYEDEYVWNYEFFTRHSLLDNELELTTNVFYNDYDNFQVLETSSKGDVKVDNVDEAYTYGAELGSRWLTTSNLELLASLGLLKTSYKDHANSSKELARAPSLTASFGALYMFAENFELSGNANYTGDYFSDVENSANQSIDAYWVANAQVAYVFTNGRMSLFATNLFDSEKETFNFGGDDITKQAPRQIGGSVELYF